MAIEQVELWASSGYLTTVLEKQPFNHCPHNTQHTVNVNVNFNVNSMSMSMITPNTMIIKYTNYTPQDKKNATLNYAMYPLSMLYETASMTIRSVNAGALRSSSFFSASSSIKNVSPEKASNSERPQYSPTE